MAAHEPWPRGALLLELSGKVASISTRRSSRTPSDSTSAGLPVASRVTERVSAGTDRAIWSPAAKVRGSSSAEPSEARRWPSQAPRSSASAAALTLGSGRLDLDLVALERHPDLATRGLGEGL